MNSLLWILPALAAPVPDAAEGDAVAVVRRALDLTAGRSYAFVSEGQFRMTGAFEPPDLLAAGIETSRCVRRGDAILVRGPGGPWTPPGADARPAAAPAPRRDAELRRTLAAAAPPHAILATMLRAADGGKRDADRHVRGTLCTQYVLEFQKQPLMNQMAGWMGDTVDRQAMAMPDGALWATLKGALWADVDKDEGRLVQAYFTSSVEIRRQNKVTRYRAAWTFEFSGFGEAKPEIPAEAARLLGGAEGGDRDPGGLRGP
jgi:hypothetical protein